MTFDYKHYEVEIAATIVGALTIAFGGRSQWGAREAGQAVFGWTNNNGLVNPVGVIDEISRLECFYWDHWDEKDGTKFFNRAHQSYLVAERQMARRMRKITLKHLTSRPK